MDCERNFLTKRPGARIVIWVLGLCAALPPGSLPAFAQSAPSMPAPSSRGLESTPDEMQEEGLPAAPEGWTVEVPVDPESYRLIPGDVLHLGIWGETVKGYPLVVSPGGILLIPKYGAVPVSGMTIRQTEAEIGRRLARFYPGATMALQLTKPGRFRVSVSGMVDRPGMVDITRLERLSSALAAAGGIRGGGSVRHVRITGPDGTLLREIDLAAWLVDGDMGSNPLLEPGCSIEVPGRGPSVRLRGPVNGRSGIEPGVVPIRATAGPEEEPGRVIECREGDTVGRIVDMAGGLSERAEGFGLLYAEDGSAPRRLDLRTESGRAVPVSPNALIEITTESRWIYVVGAVRVPGRFPYLPGMLARDYVAMAGGATEMGRNSGWTIETAGRKGGLEKTSPVESGATIRVPERRTYTITTLLTPLTSATALILSLVALRRGI